MSAGEQPYSLADVLEAEHAHLHRAGAEEPAPAEPGQHQRPEDDRLKEIRAEVHRCGHSALCLSGGGIRSASFALGVIQGLAQRKLLEGFDYLSTVSGGGFAGGWLTAWLHHSAQDGDRETVFRQLQGTGLAAGTTEPAPVSRMRGYSRYMSPQLGSLSADSWTLVATMLRNVLLNWMVLLPLVAAGLLVPRAYLEAVQYFDTPLRDDGVLELNETLLLLASIGLLMASLAFVVIDLPSYGNRRNTQARFLTWCLAPLCLGTLGLTLFWPVNVLPLTLGPMVGVSVFANVGTWVVFGLIAGGRRWRPLTWMAAALSAPILAGGIWWIISGPFNDNVELGPLYCTVALPLTFGFIAIMAMMFVALASADHSEADLEWQSRYLAWLFITIIAWLGIASLVFYAPEVFRAVRSFLGAHLKVSDLQATGLLGGLGSLLGSVTAYLLRRPPEPAAAAKPSPLRTAALLLAAPTFAVLLLGGLAWVDAAALNRLYALGMLSQFRFTPGRPETDDVTGAEVIAVAALLIVVGLVMARFVPVNKFSLHGMYRERLIRAFLGASRPDGERKPNPFTGFDPGDNIPMHALARIGRPLHVVNTTLNLVAEKGLAIQFRKAESFTITPLHAGSANLGAYRPTQEYAEEHAGGTGGGITLGTALAISGAAASPNMGSRSSPAVTFIMTMFNARLGVWLGNTGKSGHATWRRGEPGLGVGPMLRELFGRTTDCNPYVYLSDGGHFENLGLWEMVMRRCRWILVSDAGADPRYTFADLANALRLIRIDLGVPIVFDKGIAIDGSQGNPHCAVGRIQYSAIDGTLADEDGILIYVKAALSGDEPIDVRNYAKKCPDFPHESTADQWFTEAQFESYRMLGFASIASIAPDFDGRGGLRGFFEAARHGATPRVEPSAISVDTRAPMAR